MDALNRIKFLEDRLHRLSEIGMALSTEKNTDRLFEMILEEAKNITQADGRTLYSVNKDGDLDFEILKPLINETVDKIHKLDPIESQTGPARRNDQNIIEMHVNMLENKEHQNLYKIISKMIKNKYDN